MRRKSGPSSTLAPSLRARSPSRAMRSVSFTRQLAMLVERGRPSANSARTRERHRGIGDVVAVEVEARGDARRPAEPRPRAIVAHRTIRRPSARARRRTARRPACSRAPTPSHANRPPPIAPAARKYDADEASPSTADRRRGSVVRAGRNNETLPAVALDLDPEAPQEVERDLDVGLRDELADDLDDDRRRSPTHASGRLKRRAVRNWLETSPRTRDRLLDRHRGRSDRERRISLVAEVVDRAPI